jgi:hypothetical protein
MHIYKVTRTNDKISKIYFEGAASDPLVIGSFDIDWDIGVSVDASNPLQLKYKIDGWHDDYPAVEINMEPGIKGDLGVGGTSYATSPQPYFWLHPLPSNVFALGNDTEVTISPAKTGDVK